jgi:hypothetical protein
VARNSLTCSPKDVFKLSIFYCLNTKHYILRKRIGLTYPTIFVTHLARPATPTCISGKPELNPLELEMRVEQNTGPGPSEGPIAKRNSLSEVWEILSSLDYPALPDAEWLMERLTRDGRRSS